MIVPKGYREISFDFMSKEEIAKLLDRNDPVSPFHGYIGNNNAIEQVCDIIYSGFSRKSIVDPSVSNHCIGPGGIALIGPPSVGKTELAKRIARAIQLPFVECDRSVKSTNDLFLALDATCERYGINLARGNSIQDRVYKIVAPPLVVFFDEAQAIRGDWLLKATEPDDAKLITDSYQIDCTNIFWILCTTNRGKLSKAFDSRFQKIDLEPYTQKQVAQIVKGKYPNFPVEVCYTLAGYGRKVPREAIRFAKQVLLSAERQDSTDYQTICEIVAARNGVDQWGLNRQHYSVLVALYNSDFMSIKRLSDQVMISVDALEEYILPPISVSTDSLPLVGVSTRGYYITKEGVNRLTIKGYIQENKSFSVAARNK